MTNWQYTQSPNLQYDHAIYMPDDTVKFVLRDGTDCGQEVARLPYLECDSHSVIELVGGRALLRRR